VYFEGIGCPSAKAELLIVIVTGAFLSFDTAALSGLEQPVTMPPNKSAMQARRM
jgi:hypothetical protein